MAITFALTAAHVLPPGTATVSNAQGLAVSLATPLLLLNANLREVGKRASMMLPAFLCGTFASAVGGLAATQMFGGALISAYGVDGLKAAAALTAKNIGGGLNFVAVAAALQLAPAPFAAALAMDNIMALVYFPLCSWLGRNDADPQVVVASASADADEGADSRTSAAQSGALAFALFAVASSRMLAARFAPGFDLPISTIIAVFAATAIPKLIGRFARAGDELGTTSIYLFFATAGWVGGGLSSNGSLLRGGPALLGFLGVLYAVHLAIIFGARAGARLLRRRWGDWRAQQWQQQQQEEESACWTTPMILVASNANIGGPATASALAVGNGWPSLVTPGLLVGNLGYALATPLGILLHSIFRMRLL